MELFGKLAISLDNDKITGKNHFMGIARACIM